mmetsp:Transcript_8972/g.17157  ORF Transcript_8972/g.17157 Transcript_8972/m.17157 type:complete len:207 (-) Transcript_8972:1632-2252(-)
MQFTTTFLIKELGHYGKLECCIARTQPYSDRTEHMVTLKCRGTLVGDAGTFLLTNIGNLFSQKNVAVPSSGTLLAKLLSTSFALANPSTRIRANLVLSASQLETKSGRVGTDTFAALGIFIQTATVRHGYTLAGADIPNSVSKKIGIQVGARAKLFLAFGVAANPAAGLRFGSSSLVFEFKASIGRNGAFGLLIVIVAIRRWQRGG